MCPVCGIQLDWLCLVECRRGGRWPVEKEGSARSGIVRELACLFGGGIGCGISRRGVTCSRVCGA
jgi:hypothetical protein